MKLMKELEKSTLTITFFATWTVTHLHENILVLHHQRIGVDVAGEGLGLVGLCAVLQLAGYI